ncbi:hypothetical protein MVEN_00056200 [Mycena venus]|uniref:F-box domain-containing protein n=1 Tax=Mycena venus TaxID=2733690 RepID=A0A8H7DG81_9AGAR|nr:hypothetical protein MVEN_00056200 [Mycena venus]
MTRSHRANRGEAGAAGVAPPGSNKWNIFTCIGDIFTRGTRGWIWGGVEVIFIVIPLCFSSCFFAVGSHACLYLFTAVSEMQCRGQNPTAIKLPDFGCQSQEWIDLWSAAQNKYTSHLTFYLSSRFESMLPALTSLGDDLLVQILSFSDIATVLRLSQVNRYLRTLTTVKQLWLSLLADLWMKGIAETCIEIEVGGPSLKCNELIQMAKTAVKGPPQESFSQPKAMYEVALRSDTTNGSKPADTFQYARLVRGGRLVAVACATSLSLWDIPAGRQVWERRVAFEIFAAEPINVSESVVIGLILQQGQGKVFELTVINVRTGNAVGYWGIKMPNYGAYLSRQLSLCGEFAALIVCTGCILLMNWRERTAVYVRGLPMGLKNPCISLVPGYMLLTSQVSKTSETQLGIYRLADLADRWTAIVNSPSTTSFPDTYFEPLLVETPTYKGETLCNNSYSYLSALRSPAREDTYLVAFHASSQNFGIVFKYFLSVHPSETGDKEKISFRLAGQTLTPYNAHYFTLTYTGLALDSHSSGATLYRLPLGNQEAGMHREVVFENDNISVHDISSYGSVIVSMWATDVLRISYYQ